MINRIMKSIFKLIMINCLLLILIINCSPYSLPPSLQYHKEENALKYYMKSIDHFLAEEYELALESIENAIDMNRNFVM